MLVDQFFKYENNFIVSLLIVTTSFFNWSLYNQQPRWKLRNAYPCICLLLSSVFFNIYFVHVIVSLHFHQKYTLPAQNSVSSNLLTYHLQNHLTYSIIHAIFLFHYESNNSHIEEKTTYFINSTNVIYTIKQSQ